MDLYQDQHVRYPMHSSLTRSHQPGRACLNSPGGNGNSYSLISGNPMETITVPKTIQEHDLLILFCE